MGEVGYANTETTFLTLIYLTFIILTTILLLNLLIAMMSGTYAADSSEKGKTMWWMLVPDSLPLSPPTHPSLLIALLAYSCVLFISMFSC